MKFFALILLVIFTMPALAVGDYRIDFENSPPEFKDWIQEKAIATTQLSLAEVDQSLATIAMEGNFRNIQLDQSGQVFFLRFELRQKVGGIEFLGNVTIASNKLLSLIGIKVGDESNIDLLSEAVESMKSYYRSQGFLKIEIDAEVQAESNSKVVYKFKIKENERTTISKIQFVCTNPGLTKDLQKLTQRYTGRAATDQELTSINKKIRSFLLEKHYPQAEMKIDFSEATLIITIDKPDQFELEIKGVRLVNLTKLKAVLDFDHLSSTNPSIGSELFAKAKSYFLQSGYSRIDGKYEQISTANPFLKKIILTFDEGPQTKLGPIQFAGRISRPEDVYLKIFQTKQTRLLNEGLYSKEDFETALKAFALELQNQGYLTAKIISTRTQYSKNKDQISLQINLDEGPLTTIKSISFFGRSAFEEKKLTELFGFTIGSPLILSNLDQGLNNIKAFYQSNGYVEFEFIDTEKLVSYDDSNTAASIEIKMNEGPQIFIKDIIIEGNSFTKSSVISNELDFKVGDYITPSKIEESFSRLQRSGYFSSINIKLLEPRSGKNQRTIVISVTERDPGIFTVGAGATNERTLTLRGYTSIGYRNLFGTGRGVSLRVEANYNIADLKYLENKVVLGYIEPYLLGTRVRGRINLTRSKLVTNYSLRQATETSSYNYAVEKYFTSKIIGIYDIWTQSFFRDTGIDSTYTLPNREETIATTGPTLDIDYRDNPFYPTKGFAIKTSAEYASPSLGSDRGIEYYKIVSTISGYKPFDLVPGQQWVFAQQLRLGYIENKSDIGGVPWDRKGFVLGGQSTLRGFDIGTSDVFPSQNDLQTNQYFLRSRSQLALVKSEIRFPIAGPVAGAVFYDGAFVNIEGLKFKDNYRDSAGVGIRYLTPLGPVSLEWAQKLDRQPQESPFRFHLSIGSF